MSTLLKIIDGLYISGLSSSGIEFGTLDKGMLSIHDPEMIENIDFRSLGSSIGNETTFPDDYLDGCIQIPYACGIAQTSFVITTLDDTILLTHDPRELEDLDPRSLNTSVGNDIVFPQGYLDGCIQIPFELIEFYIREIATKQIEANPVTMVIQSGGTPNVVMIRSNKIRNTDALTIRQMDARTMRVTDGNSEDV